LVTLLPVKSSSVAPASPVKVTWLTVDEKVHDPTIDQVPEAAPPTVKYVTHAPLTILENTPVSVA